MSEWRSIDSAPKDGQFVLLNDNRYLSEYLIARWRVDRWWGKLTQSGKCIIWKDATHWMPLPAPPKDSGL